MRLLLDHCVHRRLAGALSAHEVKTAAEMGWDALKNGELLAAAASTGFDAVITVDKNLRYQQNLATLPLSIIELDIPDTRLPSVLAIVPLIEAALRHVARFRFVSIRADGRIETLGERV